MENCATKFIKKYDKKWKEDPKNLRENYEYQKCLTKKLDKLKPANFDREILYEIVLWKLNRFPCVDDELIEELIGVASIRPKAHRKNGKAEEVLDKLLRCKGVALPMASTILRFLNPKTFQIIDERAYRIICPGKKYPKKPGKVTDGYVKRSICIYFNYLDALHEVHKISPKKYPFDVLDRILYLIDKGQDNKLGQKV